MGKAAWKGLLAPKKKRVCRRLFSNALPHRNPCRPFSGRPWKGGRMLTFGELKKMADTPPPGRKAPSAGELGASAGLIAERTLNGGVRIAAYKSGYAVYSVYRTATVFRIHACGAYCYESCGGAYDIDGRLFDGEPWHLRLVLEGEDRLCRNCDSKEQGWNVSYSHALEEWGAMASREENVLDRIVRKETADRFLSVLTGRQRKAAGMFYLEQKTERQIAAELGITFQAVSKILAKAVKKMRLYGCGAENASIQP